MKRGRFLSLIVGLVVVVVGGVYLASVPSKAQDTSVGLRPDMSRALRTKAQRGPATRKNAYQPKRPVAQNALRPRNVNDQSRTVARLSHDQIPLPNGPIVAGTPLSKVLHTSHLSLTSTAGTDEQFVDRTNDLVADDQTTFDNVGGS